MNSVCETSLSYPIPSFQNVSLLELVQKWFSKDTLKSNFSKLNCSNEWISVILYLNIEICRCLQATIQASGWIMMNGEIHNEEYNWAQLWCRLAIVIVIYVDAHEYSAGILDTAYSGVKYKHKHYSWNASNR